MKWVHMFDCHIHSNFSGDSSLDPVEACNLAIKKQLQGIAFTDHLDYDYPNMDENFFLIDFNNYSLYMDNLKQKFSGKLKVLKGIEIGIQPHVIESTIDVVEKNNFDYVIASVHIVDGLDPYTGDFCRGKNKVEAYSRYLTEVLFAINNVNNFDMFGHLDYIRRYGDYEDKTLSHHDYSDVIDTILKKLINMGKGIEVNTSGYKYALNSPMPDYDIIKRYRQLGGELICIGSDAHCAEYIGFNFNLVKEMLLKAGFEYTVHFEERKCIFDRI